MRLPHLSARMLVVALVALIVVPAVGHVGLDRVRVRTTMAETARSAAQPLHTPSTAAPSPAAPADDTAPQQDTATGAAASEVSTPDHEPTSPAAEADDANVAEATGETTPATASADAAEAETSAPASDDTVRLDEALATVPPAKAAPRKAAAAAKAPAAKQQEPRKQKKKAKAKGRVRSLYLAIGHGSTPDGRWQPGAENPRTGQFEVDAAKVMVWAMAQELEGAPNLKLIRETGKDNPNLIGSVARANALGVDDCISIHQDTAAAPPGAFVHWYEGAGPAKRLADGIVQSIHEQGVPIRWDWHRARPGLYFLRKSTCRSVLAEVGRVGDFSTAELKQLGRAIARAYLADTAASRGVG